MMKMKMMMKIFDSEKIEYTEDEVKYSLGVDDDYEGWIDIAFQKGFKYDEIKDKWYMPINKDLVIQK